MFFQKTSNDETRTKMPRVAMYIWYFPPIISGAEQQCKRLSEELIKKGIKVFVVTERITNTKPFEVINGVQVYRVNGLAWLRRLPDYVRNIFYSLRKQNKGYHSVLDDRSKLKGLRWFSRFLTFSLPNHSLFISTLWLLYRKRNSFDILHVHEAHWIGSFGVRIGKLLNKKVIVKEPNSGDFKTFNLQSLSSQKQVAQADLFIAVSNKILSDLISIGIPKEKIKKIPNGVNINGDRWQLDHDKEPSVICVTKLNQLPHKAIDILLKAWAVLAQRYNKTVKLRIFGRGNPYLLNQLAMQLHVEDRVDFLGFVHNIEDYLLDSYLFVLPSRGEGLSNALLEAMSLGLPCVATDISGNQDLIQQGINGLLVSSEDHEALAEAVAFMLDNPEKAKDMGCNARKTVEAYYTISMVADRYKQLYRELVTDKGQERHICAA